MKDLEILTGKPCLRESLTPKPEEDPVGPLSPQEGEEQPIRTGPACKGWLTTARGWVAGGWCPLLLGDLGLSASCWHGGRMCQPALIILNMPLPSGCRGSNSISPSQVSSCQLFSSKVFSKSLSQALHADFWGSRSLKTAFHYHKISPGLHLAFVIAWSKNMCGA